MRLTNLHKIVCTTPKSCTDFAHMAGNDVEMTWDIFAYYYYKSDASHNELKNCPKAEMIVKLTTFGSS